MKLYLGLFLLIFATTKSWAMTPPNQATVEQYISLATSNDVKKLKGSGSVSCQYEFSINNYGKDSTYVSYGKDVREASLRLALLCIKERCQQVGQWIMGGLSQIDKISDSDNAEFLRAQGYSDSEIETILKNKREMDRSGMSQITCDKSTPTARMFVVDSCFVVPMRCG